MQNERSCFYQERKLRVDVASEGDQGEGSGGLTRPNRTSAAIEQRFESCVRTLSRGGVAHQTLGLLIHHRDAVELVSKLLRIQVGSEMAFGHAVWAHRTTNPANLRTRSPGVRAPDVRTRL